MFYPILQLAPTAPVAIIVIPPITHLYTVADGFFLSVDDNEALSKELTKQGSLLGGSHPTGPDTEN